MSSLQEPSLGPIIGHTTYQSARIWIRGAGSPDDRERLSEDQCCVAVVRVQRKENTNESRTYYFKLDREFDWTGTFNIGIDHNFKVSDINDNTLKAISLSPGTEYYVQVKSLVLDDASETELMSRLPHPSTWKDEFGPPDLNNGNTACFRTFPKKRTKKLRFLLGSCRYPLYKNSSDRIFGTMLTEVSTEPNIRFVLMLGDQIYADKFRSVFRAEAYEEFQKCYLTAFGSPNMRRLLRRVPSYMILDDHEIKNNWGQDQCEKHKNLFENAIRAYRNYQWSHSPRTFGEKFFYHFDCGGYPFFVLDVRTERYNRGDLMKNHLLGSPAKNGDPCPQLKRVCEWLAEKQNKLGDIPKFIATSSVFVPNKRKTVGKDKAKRKSDSWPAYPQTRRALLHAIVDNNVQNVVFLSGDAHHSNVAEILFEGSEEAKKLKAFSVTSSAFHWPFLNGKPSHYVHNSEESQDTFELSPNTKNGIVMNYVARNFIQENNFCIVEVDEEYHRLTVTVRNKEGQVLTPKGSGKLACKLELAPW